MSTVRTVVHPGWIAVTGPGVDAVVAAADRHAPALEEAARGGLLALLEALTAHGLSAAPDLVACAPTPTGLRVVVRGAGVAVLPDGTRVGSDGRMPWADLDVDVAEGAEVVLEAPEPEVPRGWRRPARLSRGTDERAPIDQVVTAGTPEPEAEPLEPSASSRTVDRSEAESEPARPPERDNFDLLVDLDPAEPARRPSPSRRSRRAGAGARAPAGPDPAPTRRRRGPAAGRPGARDAAAAQRADRLGAVAPTRRREPGAVGRRGAPCAPAPSPTELLPVIEPDPQPAADAAAPAPDGVRRPPLPRGRWRCRDPPR